MQTSYFSLSCQNCGWAREVSYAWLRTHFPGMTDDVHVYSREYLDKIAQRLKCSSCGEKKAKLCARKPQERQAKEREDLKYKKADTGETKQKGRKKGTKVRASGLNEIKRLLKDDIAWIYGGEVSVLQSYKRQIEAGNRLTEKQRATVKAIGKRVQKRKDAKFVRGGSPGLRHR